MEAARSTTLACIASTLREICSARNPLEVSAVSINSGLKSLADIDETTAATLRFGDDQLATFVTSFNAADVAAYRIVGHERTPAC